MTIQERVPLKELTTFHIGGDARYFVEVKNIDDIREALKFAAEKDLQHVILGGGSNILVSDQGYDGLVIKIALDEMTFDGVEVTVGAGVNLLMFLRALADHGLAGLEGMAGVPGSVGGAVRGNAGAFGVEISDCITEVAVLSMETGEVKSFAREECEYSYRQSMFKRELEYIVLSAKLELSQGIPAEIHTKMDETIQLRESKHIQDIQSAGSFFMNPVVDEEVQQKFKDDKGVESRGGRVPAGWLLERVGLHRKSIGGVQAGKMHANYFINTGDGTAEDAMQLASLAKTRVRSEFGVQLREEVQFIGF